MFKIQSFKTLISLEKCKFNKEINYSHFAKNLLILLSFRYFDKYFEK